MPASILINMWSAPVPDDVRLERLLERRLTLRDGGR
jgi:hypothetical protein